MSNTTFRIGTIESVVSNYGQIRFDDDSASSKAFFDFDSVGNALDDLTLHFKKGMKIKAKTEELGDAVHADNRLKAYSVMLVDHVDPAIRGGDIYLKKLMERIGPQELDSLLNIIIDQTDNCPKFLKSNKIEGVKKVVLSRPDWFKITNDLCLTVIPSEKVAESKLLSILQKQISIPINDFDSILYEEKTVNRYLTARNVIDFVSRHADSLVVWKDSIWSCNSMREETEKSNKFQNDMMAVKYYSQFVGNNGKVTINALRGHYSQASKMVQQAVKSKDPDFRLFYKRNHFFFNLNEDDFVSCFSDRLPMLDKYWLLPKAEQSKTVTTSAIDQSASVKTPISPSDSTHGHVLNKQQVEDLLKDHLEQKGAINLADWKGAGDDACDVECDSEVVARLGIDELRQVAENCPSTFSIKNEYLCLNLQENTCIAKLCGFVESSPCAVADLKLKFGSDQKYGQYIMNCENENGVYDFVARNAGHFLFWENSIHLCKQVFEDFEKTESFKSEMRAVQYYATFIKKNCPTPIVSVRGHYAQATEEIRKVAHSRPADFITFLKRNEIFFEVSDDRMIMNENHCRNLRLIEIWLDPDFQPNSPILPTALSTPTESDTHQSAYESEVKAESIPPILPTTLLTSIKSNTNQMNGNLSDGNSEFRVSEEKTEPIPYEDSKDIEFPIQESRAFIEDIPSEIPVLTPQTLSSDTSEVDRVMKNNVSFEHSISNNSLDMSGFGNNLLIRLWKQKF